MAVSGGAGERVGGVRVQGPHPVHTVGGSGQLENMNSLVPNIICDIRMSGLLFIILIW